MMSEFSRANEVDMSAEAVTQRLINVSDLAEFCLVLKHAKALSSEDASQLGPRRHKLTRSVGGVKLCSPATKKE